MLKKDANEMLMEKVARRSQDCEREILAVGYNYLGMPVAGMVLVGPNSVQVSQQVAPDYIVDANLN